MHPDDDDETAARRNWSESESASNPLLNATYVCSSTGSLELLGVQSCIPYTVHDFESLYRKSKEEKTVCELLKEAAAKKWRKFSLKKTIAGNFPTLSKMKNYKVKEYLPNDIVAGLTVGITMIPQGMAFASLSTLQPIVGLYISFFASIAYFFLGTCHQLSWGCVAVLSILMGNILDDYDAKTRASALTDLKNVFSPLDVVNKSTVTETMMAYSANITSAEGAFQNRELSQERRLEVACAVTMISGLLLALLGKLGLGRLTSFMSDSLITSFTVGVSFHVVTSQAKTALGLDIDSVPSHNGVFKFVRSWVTMLENFNKANPTTIIISVLCLAILYTVKRFINEKFKSRLRVPIPIELFVLIIATIICSLAKLSERFSVKVVEDIPVGVPTPKIPDLSLGVPYITEGLVIIIVSFTQNVAMAKLMGLKHNYRIDANQEMFACGAVSVVCSMFSGYIAGPSVSRSMVQDGAGGKTQVASLFAAALVLLVIMVIGPYFYYLPRCVLATIIIINLLSMFLKILTLPDLWRRSRVDALVWIITCLATVFLETDIGLLVGIINCILLVLIRSQMNTVDVVSEIPLGNNTSLWRSQDKYVGEQTGFKGVKVVRINSALYFANAEIMTDQVFKKTGVNPVKLARTKTINVSINGQDKVESINVVQTSDNSMLQNGERDVSLPNEENMTPEPSNVFNVPFSTLIVDLSSMPFVDVMGVQGLEFLVAKYTAIGVKVYFVNPQEICVGQLQKTGFLEKHKSCVFLNMGAALRHIE